MAQNRRLRDWRIANSSECNNNKCIRITDGEVTHWSRRRIPVRLHSIINIIIVMSTVGSATSVFYESLASEQGYRAAYVNKYDRTTLFYAKRVTAVSSPGGTMRETASRNTSGYALGWTIKNFLTQKKLLFSHYVILGHLEIRFTNNGL